MTYITNKFKLNCSYSGMLNRDVSLVINQLAVAAAALRQPLRAGDRWRV